MNRGPRSDRELELIERIRAACADLPECEVAVDGFGHTVFRVRRKSFVMIGDGHGSGSLFIKSDPLSQEALIRRGPYIRAPYIGQHGWVAVWGEESIDWDEVAGLVRDAWRLAAPKRLAARVDAD